MESYRIKFKSSAAKEFRKLAPSVQQRLRVSINELKTNPRPSGVTKLKGSDHLYRIRVGDYRVIYSIDDAIKIILITRVRHRREAYET